MIETLLSESNIFNDIQGKTKEKVLKTLIEKIDVSISSKKTFFEDVLLREKQLSTGLTHGIAIPHSQSEAVKESFIAVGRLEQDIVWETLDDSKVNFIILIGVPKHDKNQTHLTILSKIAERLMDETVIEKLLNTYEPLEIKKILEE